SLANLGDGNGDGIAGFIVGAHAAAGGTGTSYVRFGTDEGPGDVALDDLGERGFRIFGEAAGDNAGRAVSSAGDFNGDGYDDILIGARKYGAADHCAAYVVYGKAGGFGDVKLSGFEGHDGFQINAGGVGIDNAYGA